MTTTDTYFCIGKTHAICQDYAQAGANYAILADGCSTAAESHLGAILLARAAKANIHVCSLSSPCSLDAITADVFCQRVLATAATYAKVLGLNPDALCATLGVITLVNGVFQVLLYGDGIIACRYRNTTTWDVNVFEFVSGAPFYLRYKLDYDCEREYLKVFGKDGTTHTNFELPFVDKYVQKQSILGPFMSACSAKEYDACAILSDGAMSFSRSVITSGTSKQNEAVPIEAVLQEVLAFKNYKGAFVQRRCHAAFRKFAQHAWQNNDDFSLAAIYDDKNQVANKNDCCYNGKEEEENKL